MNSLTPHFEAAISRQRHISVRGYPSLTNENFMWMASQLADKKVLEVGCGLGWIASELIELGVDITPTDLWPNQHNPYWKHEYFSRTKIEQKDAVSAVKEYDFDVLLMSWPCYGDDWAYDALCALSPGTDLLYIGEGREGCCATNAFFDKIDDLYEKWVVCPHYEPFRALHDYVIYYKA